MSGGDTSGAANFEPAVDVISGRASAPPVIILCDHASNALPAGYGTLGLPEAELDRHIGYDIGAAGVARGLAALLGTAAVLSRWSRLLIDLNRGLDDPTLIMRLSDGAVIPGNRHVDIAERERRIDACWRPYHAAVAGLIDAELVQGRTPILVSIHSFTNIWRGAATCAAADRGIASRREPDRRRQRAVFGQVAGRHAVAARDVPGPTARHRRNPAGPDRGPAGAGRLGRAIGLHHHGDAGRSRAPGGLGAH